MIDEPNDLFIDIKFTLSSAKTASSGIVLERSRGLEVTTCTDQAMTNDNDQATSSRPTITFGVKPKRMRKVPADHSDRQTKLIPMEYIRPNATSLI